MLDKEEVLRMLEKINARAYNHHELSEVFTSMVEALGFAPEPEPEPAPEPTPEPEPADESEVDNDGPNFSND